MSLKVIRRKDSDSLQIVGTINLPDGTSKFVRKAPQSKILKIAREEAAALETELIRLGYHGQRRGVRPFSDAVQSYLDSGTRAEGDKQRLIRICEALGNVAIGSVNQEMINEVRKKILKPEASPSTISRGIIVPVRAVLRHAQKLGWCDMPVFELPKRVRGRTNYLLPPEVDQLVVAAAPHIKPLIVFNVGTGARMSEAIELEWRDVDLVGARATFWDTKNGERRVAALPPVVVKNLAAIPHRDGRVFRWQTVTPKRAGKAPPRVADYADRKREYGGQIKTAWHGAIRRSGLNPELHPHDLRHTWASWHYAVNRDLLALKVEGGWSSVTLVERYAHLLPAGYEKAISDFLNAA